MCIIHVTLELHVALADESAELHKEAPSVVAYLLSCLDAIKRGHKNSIGCTRLRYSQHAVECSSRSHNKAIGIF